MQRTLHVRVADRVLHPGEGEQRRTQDRETPDDRHRQQPRLQACRLVTEMVAQRQQQNLKPALGVAYSDQHLWLQSRFQ
jgi:hypothetical protein